jgi:hypothetical protein
MKKTIVLVTTLLISSYCYSQDMGDDQVPKNKKGNEILPKKGDIGIGFNTIPILDAFFNIFKSNSSNPDIVQYGASNNQVMGKYFLGPKTAIRVRLGVNTISGTVQNNVQDADAMYKASLGSVDDMILASNMTVQDKLTYSKNNLMISIGLEKRRGYRRLQGFYGGEIGFGNTGSRYNVSYGNAYSDLRPTYFTSDFNSGSVTSYNPQSGGISGRVKKSTSTGGFRFGVRGFVGIEYFIFAKISIGAEYGWSYSVATQRGSSQNVETYWNGQNGPRSSTEKVNTEAKELAAGFSIDNNNGNAFSMNNTVNGNTALSGGAGALTVIFHF